MRAEMSAGHMQGAAIAAGALTLAPAAGYVGSTIAAVVADTAAGSFMGAVAVNGPQIVASAEIVAGTAATIATGGGAPNPMAGGGAQLGNISTQAATRIQNAVNRTNTTVTPVGSRATGTARLGSDWDYVINANAKTRNSLSSSLPGAGNIREGIKKDVDIFQGQVDRSLPYIEFKPEL